MESGDKIFLLTDTPRNTSRKRRQPDDKVSLPKLTTRSSPKALVDSIAKFNDEQKRAVEKMGFGYLLHLKIREIPSNLSFWLVDNFDPLSSVLRFSDGNIHIEAVDVEKVLGFPRGDKPIKLKTKSETVDLLDKWRSQFLVSSERITPEEVSKKMLDCKFEDGGEMFCCNFAALVDALIIGSINSGGYVNPLFLKSVSDITCVTNLNWAEYTLQSLIAKTLKWDHGKMTSFNGPLLFLVVLYVDRLVFISRDVPRSLPSFIGWNCELLRKRSIAEVKKGGFGRGYVDDRMELLALQQQQQLLETLKLKQKKISDADVVQMQSVPQPNEKWDVEYKARLFRESMSNDLRKAGFDDKIEDIDMILFPVCKSDHLYVVSFDFKKDAINILDNSSVGGTTLSKYYSQHVHLRDFLVEYLRSRNLQRLADKVSNMKIGRITFPWRDNKNKVDCGVFVMRHMETYYGGDSKNWNSGLIKNKPEQLKEIRIKYCSEIVLNDFNEVKTENEKKINAFHAKKNPAANKRLKVVHFQEN